MSNPKKIFINLPVGDLARSVAFYESMGATQNPQFSDPGGAGMVLSETIHVMLLTHEKYLQFSPRPIPDAHGSAQVLLCYTTDSRDAVDETMARIAASGGVIDPTPADDYSFMYGRSFEDPDGHLWQVMWFDEDAHKAAATAESVEA